LDELAILGSFSECDYLPQAGGDSGVNSIDIAEACKKKKNLRVNFTKTKNMSSSWVQGST